MVAMKAVQKAIRKVDSMAAKKGEKMESPWVAYWVEKKVNNLVLRKDLTLVGIMEYW